MNGSSLYDRYPYDQHGNNSFKDYLKWLNPGYSSLFQNLENGTLPVPERFADAVADVDAIYATWMGWKISAIREVAGDDNHLITVGYNTLYGLLPSNIQLDFVNHHAYPNAPGGTFTFDNFTEASFVPSTLDRLAGHWWSQAKQPRPITLGEFGTSDGDFLTAINSTVPLQASAAADAVVWLTAWALDQDGANRWRLNDCPFTLNVVLAPYIGNVTDPSTRLTYLREGYFGLYIDDGTVMGRPKPVAVWLRFFSEFVRTALAAGSGPGSGTLTLLPAAENPTWLGHVYRAPQAVFCGGWMQYRCTPGLEYTSERGEVTLVGLYWCGNAEVRLQATADTRVQLDMALLSKGHVRGVHNVSLLAGVAVTLPLHSSKQP